VLEKTDWLPWQSKAKAKRAAAAAAATAEKNTTAIRNASAGVDSMEQGSVSETTKPADEQDLTQEGGEEGEEEEERPSVKILGK
jgi:hypothetical protein